MSPATLEGRNRGRQRASPDLWKGLTLVRGERDLSGDCRHEWLDDAHGYEDEADERMVTPVFEGQKLVVSPAGEAIKRGGGGTRDMRARLP